MELNNAVRAVPPPIEEEDFEVGALLNLLVATTPECIKIVSRDGRLLQMNPAGLTMIGAPSWQSVEAACVFELIAPEHRTQWIENHLRVCRGERLAWEFDIISLNGTRRHMETHAAPINLRRGGQAQLAVTRDVTGRKTTADELKSLNLDLENKVTARTRELELALSRLQASERSFGLLVQSVTDYAIYMLDPTGLIVSWNSGAQRIKGYETSEIIGRHFDCFYTEEDRTAGVPMRGLRTAAREGRLETEGWRLRKDGSRFLANVIIDAIYSDGELVGFAKITRDITERRKAEAQMRQAQKMEAVGQFTGGAAHDFNNLLMAVLGSLELLRKRLPDDPRLIGLLDNAVQGAKRGASLTQRMLAFARRQELKQQTVDVASLVENMRALLERSLGPTTSIVFHFPPEAVYVRTDVNQLETALLNLAINGRDAMADGGTITIAVRAEALEEKHPTNLPGGRYVCLSVTDTGSGMDEATLARAREPFFTTKGVGKGTGLGLSMVDGLTEQSGGKLLVHSSLGQGTTVELWLPAVAQAGGLAMETLQKADLAQSATQPLFVLAVDDDALVLSNIEAMLEDLGHRVIAVPSGERAIAALDAHPDVDLLITDQAMPGMTGLQLIDAVKKQRPLLPVILATGYAELPSGSNASLVRLSKPYTQADLVSAIRVQV